MPSLIQFKDGVAGIKTPLEKPLFRIGRDADNDLCVEDALISREHAIIERVQSTERDGILNYVLRDLGSTNGTFVNHLPVKDHILCHGDMIRLGRNFLQFSEEHAPDPTATAKLQKSFIPGLYFVKKDEGKKS